jgi:hypothetical protein
MAEPREQTAAAHRFIRDNIGSERPRLWYNAIAQTQLPYVQIASTYLWQYVLINQNLPRLSDVEAAALNVGTPVVLLVSSAQEAERTRPALAVFGLDYQERNKRSAPASKSRWMTEPSSACHWRYIQIRRRPASVCVITRSAIITPRQ